MIIIRKGQANNVVLTLKENSSLSTPFYLFEFRNESENRSKFFTASDISIYPDRYNEFVVTEKDSNVNYNAGEVDLRLSGMWTYIVREQASSTNLDPALSGAIVETGRVKVVGDAVSVSAYDGIEKTNTVYQG